jgi:hypothetical protein
VYSIQAGPAWVADGLQAAVRVCMLLLVAGVCVSLHAIGLYTGALYKSGGLQEGDVDKSVCCRQAGTDVCRNVLHARWCMCTRACAAGRRCG